jgi:hypothetical protein
MWVRNPPNSLNSVLDSKNGLFQNGEWPISAGHHGRDNLRRIRPQASRESRRTAKSVTLLAPPPQLPHPPARLYRGGCNDALADVKSRIEHHKTVLTAAWSDYYAGAKCLVQGNDQEPHHVLEGTGGDAALFFMAIRR